jgi:DNA-binding CsgD family transcriptional regulator
MRDVPRAGAAIGGQTLAVVARAAAVISSTGTVQERVSEVLQEVRAIVPFRAAMVATVDSTTGGGREIMREDYPDRLAQYMRGEEFQAELVEPFGFDRSGWPFRERDLPIDPMSLRVVAEYLRPDYVEGLLSALVTPQGRYLGFLILSCDDASNPTDAACAAVGHIAPMLANLVDPLHSARWLASTLLEEETAVALLPDGTATVLRGEAPSALLDADSAVRRSAARLVGERRPVITFLSRGADGGWLRCRLFCCRDGTPVLAVRSRDSVYELTPRELEVVRHLVDGQTNGEIAAALWITQRTVRAHVERILEKLDVTNRSGAVAKALTEGLLLAD